MAGLLDRFFGSPDQTQALGLLGIGMMRGGFGDGAAMAMQHMAGADERKIRRGLLEAQLSETQAQAREREIRARREEDAIELERRRREAMPTLFRQPGMTGGDPVPQTIGDVPMFSKPIGAGPMQATPGGFDVQRALALGYKPEEITALHNLTNLGMPKVARTVEVDDGRGGKATMQLDEFGRPVGQSLPGYIAPVQVNQGDRVTFQRPQAGVSLPVNMSPEARASNALGWANHGLSRQRLSFDQQNAGAGRAPQGYRFKADGTLEAIPGGPADKQSAATTDERKAATLLKRLEGSQQQLNAALQKSPGAAKPEAWASGIRALPVPGSEALANTITSTERQRVEAAQMDMLDAALTLGTGAAYTREQLEGYRKSYFPQIGDDPATVRDKQARLNNVIEAARIAAGRAGNQIPQQGGATGGWSIQKVN